MEEVFHGGNMDFDLSKNGIAEVKFGGVCQKWHNVCTDMPIAVVTKRSDTSFFSLSLALM